MYNLLQFNSMKLAELKAVAEELKIESGEKLKKQELIFKIIDAQRVLEQNAVATEIPATSQNSEGVDVVPAVNKPRRERVKKPSDVRPADDVNPRSHLGWPRRAMHPLVLPVVLGLHALHDPALHIG